MLVLKSLLGVVTVVVALTLVPSPASAATCDDYPNQAAAQQAQDTRDADGDGIYCETLPCPCAAPGDGGGSGGNDHERREPKAEASCTRTRRVVRVTLDREKYRAVLRHMRRAVRDGWPRVLRLNRGGADQRRDRLLDDNRYPTRRGMDRDEWPMAFARRSWRADVAYVPSSQNRGAGASLGNQLRAYCDGVRFKVVGV